MSLFTCTSDTERVRTLLALQFLSTSVYLEGIKVYEHLIRSLSSFDGA